MTREFMAERGITVEAIANALCGNACWVKWPYLQEALVEAVSDENTTVSYTFLTAVVHTACPIPQLTGTFAPILCLVLASLRSF